MLASKGKQIITAYMAIIYTKNTALLAKSTFSNVYDRRSQQEQPEFDVACCQ